MGIDGDRVEREQQLQQAREQLYQLREVLPKRSNRLIRNIDEALRTDRSDVLGQQKLREEMAVNLEAVSLLFEELGELVIRSEAFWET